MCRRVETERGVVVVVVGGKEGGGVGVWGVWGGGASGVDRLQMCLSDKLKGWGVFALQD